MAILVNAKYFRANLNAFIAMLQANMVNSSMKPIRRPPLGHLLFLRSWSCPYPCIHRDGFLPGWEGALSAASAG